MILTHIVVISRTSIACASIIFLVSLNCVIPLSLLEKGSLLVLRYSLLHICSNQHCLTLSVCLVAGAWTVSFLKNCQGNFISNLSFLSFPNEVEQYYQLHIYYCLHWHCKRHVNQFEYCFRLWISQTCLESLATNFPSSCWADRAASWFLCVRCYGFVPLTLCYFSFISVITVETFIRELLVFPLWVKVLFHNVLDSRISL